MVEGATLHHSEEVGSVFSDSADFATTCNRNTSKAMLHNQSEDDLRPQKLSITDTTVAATTQTMKCLEKMAKLIRAYRDLIVMMMMTMY